MARAILKAVLALTMVGCGGSSGARSDGPYDPELQAIKDATLPWASRCDFEGLEIPCEGGVNQDHSIMWAGFLCLSGETKYCEVARRSVDAEGRVWRSPSQVGVKEGNSSSRDAFLGFLAYAARTKDRDLLWKSFLYLRAHDDKLCDDADDNRCDMDRNQYRVIWGTYKRAFQAAGLQVPPKMDEAANGDEPLLIAQAKASPPGYRTHLNAVQIHIRQYLGKGSGNISQAARIIRDKQRLNPYYEYVAEGVTPRLASLTKEHCTAPVPAPADRKDWYISQDQDKKTWHTRMGWDCIFLVNLVNLK